VLTLPLWLAARPHGAAGPGSVAVGDGLAEGVALADGEALGGGAGLLTPGVEGVGAGVTDTVADTLVVATAEGETAGTLGPGGAVRAIVAGLGGPLIRPRASGTACAVLGAFRCSVGAGNPASAGPAVSGSGAPKLTAAPIRPSDTASIVAAIAAQVRPRRRP
jgi:hypothetical protein